jgi:hypothetical protein
MDTIKVIDLSSGYSNKSKKLSKKQIYKEILSSSDRVKDIINRRKKTKRFDYLNTIPLKQPTPPQPTPQQPTPQQPTPQQLRPPQPRPITPAPIKSTQINKHSNTDINFIKPIKSFPTQNTGIKSHPKAINANKKVTCNKKNSSKEKKISDFFTSEKNQRKIPKKIQYTQEKSSPKSFNQNQIVELIKIIYKLNELDEYIKLHKLIRRLNKLQTNQLLFALRLIKTKSNAPVTLLKNTLFNFVTGNVKVYRE